jgi:circadian clock protein KaiB
MNNPHQKPYYVLTLYISGMNEHSLSAVKNLKKICDEYLSGQHEIKVIDVLTHPEKASENQIFATPTLVKELPYPVSRLIGDLSNTNQVLIDLEIKQES